MSFDHINQLIDSLKKLQDERNSYIERIQKLVEKGDAISEEVFHRIKSDYEHKLDTLNSEIYPLLEELSLRKSEIVNDINIHEEKLKIFLLEKEEIEVRFDLGEFDEKKCTKMIKELESANEGKFDELNAFKEIGEKIEEALETEITNGNLPNFEDPEVDEEEIDDIGHEEIQLDDTMFNEDVKQNEIPDAPDSGPYESELPPPPPPVDVNLEDRTVFNMEEADFDGGSTVLFSSPVIIIKSGLHAGEEFKLKMGTTNIGSSHENDIILSDDTIADKHAQVTFGPDGFTIYDFNVDGLEVRGKKVSEYLMQPGELFRLGDIDVQFNQ